MVEITAALRCDDSYNYAGRTEVTGNVHLGGTGFSIPTGCDLYVAAPGLETLVVSHKELCGEPPQCRSTKLVVRAVECQPVSESDRSCDHFTHRLVLGKRNDGP